MLQNGSQITLTHQSSIYMVKGHHCLGKTIGSRLEIIVQSSPRKSSKMNWYHKSNNIQHTLYFSKKVITATHSQWNGHTKSQFLGLCDNFDMLPNQKFKSNLKNGKIIPCVLNFYLPGIKVFQLTFSIILIRIVLALTKIKSNPINLLILILWMIKWTNWTLFKVTTQFKVTSVYGTS